MWSAGDAAKNVPRFQQRNLGSEQRPGCEATRAAGRLVYLICNSGGNEQTRKTFRDDFFSQQEGTGGAERAVVRRSASEAFSAWARFVRRFLAVSLGRNALSRDEGGFKSRKLLNRGRSYALIGQAIQQVHPWNHVTL